jgi:hypothetical protein
MPSESYKVHAGRNKSKQEASIMTLEDKQAVRDELKAVAEVKAAGVKAATEKLGAEKLAGAKIVAAEKIAAAKSAAGK